MDSILQKHVTRLKIDAQRIGQGLDNLVENYSDWIREHEEKNMTELSGNVSGLETDLIEMVKDCMIVFHCLEKEEKGDLFNDLHKTFLCLDVLFSNLRKVRWQMKDAYIHPGLLDHLEINSERLNEIIGQLQRHLN